MPKDNIEKSLVRAAVQAQTRAYAPYSDHPVGASILTAAGKIYSGCNVENAASPLGCCAEASAISNMVNAGCREIDTVAVVGPGRSLCTPCGGCRQLIREFAAPETKVICCDKDGKQLEVFTLDELLPHSFGPANLGEIREMGE